MFSVMDGTEQGESNTTGYLCVCVCGGGLRWGWGGLHFLNTNHHLMDVSAIKHCDILYIKMLASLVFLNL